MLESSTQVGGRGQSEEVLDVPSLNAYPPSRGVLILIVVMFDAVSSDVC